MNILLTRYSYSPTETQGILYIGDELFYTIEKPWRNNVPYKSCIPEGVYEVEPFKRPNGQSVYRLWGPDYDVYREESDIPARKTGRFLILIHQANFEREVVGCIAPGLSCGCLQDPAGQEFKNAVKFSRLAMDKIRSILGRDLHTLEIRQVLGAKNGA